MSRHLSPRYGQRIPCPICVSVSLCSDPKLARKYEVEHWSRKVKNGEKSPWGQCLTTPVPNGRRHSGFWLGRKTQTFSGTNQKPERRWPFGTGLVRHCPQRLFSAFFTFLRAIFFHPFRLSLAPTICPWVSEDGANGPPQNIHCRTGSRDVAVFGCADDRHDLLSLSIRPS